MPEEAFETPQPIQPIESKSTSWPRIILVAILGFALLCGAAYAGYWYGTGGAKVNPPEADQVSKPTPVVSQPTPKLTPTPDPIANWEVFRGAKYMIKYPSNWVLEGPYEGLSGFPEEIMIFSPGRYTALSVTLGQPPYGFAGPVEFKTGNTFTIQVGDTSYEVTENRYREGENPSDAIFWDLAANEHTAMGIGVGGEQEELPFHFVFGNDYPSHARSSTKSDSEVRYNEDLKTARQILSTFKLLE